MGREMIPTGPDCPYFESCHLRANETPDCPVVKRDLTTYRNRHPLSLAEDLCISALERVGRSLGKDPYKDQCEEIGDMLDYSLSLAKHSPSRAGGEFEAMSARLAEILDKNDDYHALGREKYHAALKALSAYLPAFHDRLIGKPLSQESALKVHINMCKLLEEFDETYINTNPKPSPDKVKHLGHIRDEWEQIALLTRLGNGSYFPWIPTSMEEASEGRAENNHDYYRIDSMERKIPVQVKRSRSGSGYKGVTTIVHYDILRAVRETRSAQGYNYNLEDVDISKLLVYEGANQELNTEAANILNLASIYIISRLDGHTDFRRD